MTRIKKLKHKVTLFLGKQLKKHLNIFFITYLQYEIQLHSIEQKIKFSSLNI